MAHFQKGKIKMAKSVTKAATATRTAANTMVNPIDAYKSLLAGWPVKYAGAKPAAVDFERAHQLGARVGTKTAIALAMYFRPMGATQSQVTVVNNGPYLNAARAAIAAGHAVAVATPPVDGHKVYKLALPVKKAKAAPKAKAAAKAAPKAKANDAATPTVDAANAPAS